MRVEKPNNVSELQEELIITCQELTSDIFLLECLLQYSKNQYSTSGNYSAEDCGLALRRVISYTEQHSKDTITINSAIMNLLCKEAPRHTLDHSGFGGDR
jgi:hypothetical protein